MDHLLSVAAPCCKSKACHDRRLPQSWLNCIAEVRASKAVEDSGVVKGCSRIRKLQAGEMTSGAAVNINTSAERTHANVRPLNG